MDILYKIVWGKNNITATTTTTQQHYYLKDKIMDGLIDERFETLIC